MDSTPKPWSHIYSTLTRPDSIRLLELEPAADNHDQLRGSLISTTLEEVISDVTNRYTALSYVWGNPAQSGSIHVSGCDVKITASLSQALHDIRHPSRATLIWADALCINQQNANERSRQVRIMGEIYRKAASTIIYLGPLQTDCQYLFSHIATKNLESLRLQSMDRANLDSALGSSYDHSIVSSSSFDAEYAQRGPETDHTQLAQAVDKLCSNDWFTRAWVFQELVLSADPRIQCGKMLAQWSDVAEVAGSEDIEKMLVPQVQRKRRQVFLRMNTARNRRVSNTMADLIRARAGSHVSDPRDFFYSLMGIADDRQEWETIISMDYNVPVRLLYTSVARHLLYSGGIEIKDFPSHQCSDREPIIKSSSSIRSLLPSWVPDWNVLTSSLSQHMEKPSPNPPLNKGNNIGVLNEILVLPCSPKGPKRIKKLSGLIPGRLIDGSNLSELTREASRFFLPNRLQKSAEHTIFGNTKSALDYLQLYDDRSSSRGLSSLQLHNTMEASRAVDWGTLFRSADAKNDDVILNEAGSFRFALLHDNDVVVVPARSKLGDELMALIGSITRHTIPANRSLAVVGRPLSGYEDTNVDIARYAEQHILPSARHSFAGSIDFHRGMGGFVSTYEGDIDLQRIEGDIDSKDEYLDIRHYNLLGATIMTRGYAKSNWKKKRSCNYAAIH